MRNKDKITLKELHERMKKPRCRHCGRIQDEHALTVSGRSICIEIERSKRPGLLETEFEADNDVR